MQSKIAYLFDSSSCYTQEDPEHDLYLVPCNIVLQEQDKIKTFAENTEITQDEIVQLFLQKKDVKTSLVNPGLIKQKVLDLLKKYDQVVYVPISYTISSTYEKTLLIANEINSELKRDAFLVIKSNAVSFLASIVMQRFVALYDGKNFNQVQKQILEEVEQNQYCGFLFVNNIDALIKGGRIKKAKGFIAKLLNFKIIIFMGESLQFYDKALSYNLQIQKAIDFFNNLSQKYNKPIDQLYPIFDGLQSTRDKYVNELHFIDQLKTKLNLTKDYKYQEGILPGCIKVHTGLNSAAVIIRLKQD